jgi:hypothetical protein
VKTGPKIYLKKVHDLLVQQATSQEHASIYLLYKCNLAMSAFLANLKEKCSMCVFLTIQSSNAFSIWSYTWNTTCSTFPNTTDELIPGLHSSMPVKWCQTQLHSILKTVLEISDPLYIWHNANTDHSVLQTKGCFICRSATAKPVDNKNKNLLHPPQ